MGTASEIMLTITLAAPRAMALRQHIENTVLREIFRIGHARCMWRLHLLSVRNAAQHRLTWNGQTER